jgi:hypothetical protein
VPDLRLAITCALKATTPEHNLADNFRRICAFLVLKANSPRSLYALEKVFSKVPVCCCVFRYAR